MGRQALLVMTKPAQPGRVKTRLAERLGEHGAAALHAAFLDDLIERLASAGLAPRPVWALQPDEPVPGRPPGGRRQRGRDLGERLANAFADLEPGIERAVAIGSDHPELAASRVREAFARLAAGAEIVLGPAADGGYYLVGLHPRRLRRELFAGVPWSTPEVLRTTLARCRELGLAVELLAVEEDVDTPADLERLAARLAARPGGCPRTRSELAALGVVAAEGRPTCGS